MFTPINNHFHVQRETAAAGRGPVSALSSSPYFASPGERTRVPRSDADDAESGVVLLPTSALPDRLRSLFSFQYFNAMQSKSFDTLFASDNSVVLSAPTASGKTVCFELAIARLLTAPAVNHGHRKVRPTYDDDTVNSQDHLHWTHKVTLPRAYSRLGKEICWRGFAMYSTVLRYRSNRQVEN
jgi:hypothetical protein